MTTGRAVRLLLGIGGLVLSEGLARCAHAQNPPAPGAAVQPAVVSGVVVDSAGIPIPHAVLSVVGESLRVITDSAGRFRLAVSPGPRLLAVRALGYRPLMWALALEPGQSASGRIGLQRLSVVLSEITVVGRQDVPSRLAGFYQRRQLGLGKYIDRETIERRFTNSMSDLLQQIPGVHVSGVRVSHDSTGEPFKVLVSFARCNRIGDARSPVGVYVDGFRIFGDPGETLALINPGDVEAIEVYRGPSELPAEFMSDDCAAIVIWTKY